MKIKHFHKSLFAATLSAAIFTTSAVFAQVKIGTIKQMYHSL
jgi:hypothetical protein